MTCDHVFADLNGVTASRLSDAQGLGALLLSAANAAGMWPAGPPVVQAGQQRGLDVVIRRLAARDVRADARRRGPAPAAHLERA